MNEYQISRCYFCGRHINQNSRICLECQEYYDKMRQEHNWRQDNIEQRIESENINRETKNLSDF
jgi:tRNA A-37 threonylcarbamoyl transferase component Bud32